MSENEGKTDTWCGEFTAPGVLCPNPAEVEVIYGRAPDETFFACRAHGEQDWQPTWQTRPLTAEERQRYAVPWSEWVKPEFTAAES